MLIGEIARKTGLSRDTIRFYERQGLIVVSPGKSDFNNYKNYTEDILKRLTMIKQIKGFGFTLTETAELLRLIDFNQASCQTVADKVNDKIAVIDQKISELLEMRSMLGLLIGNCCQPDNLQQNCPSITSISQN